LGAQHDKLDADLQASALIGTPSVQPVHDYYPFALEDGGKWASFADDLVDRLAVLVASPAWVQRTLVYCVLAIISTCNISFVDQFMFPFDDFWGMCGENSSNLF
jgi:hypothetical protein